MKHKNTIQIVGNLGLAPELKTINNVKLVKLSVAVNQSIKYRNGHVAKKTYWHKVIAWGKLAEQIKAHTKQGSVVLVEGKLKNKTYINKLGVKQSFSEIVACNVIVNYSKQAA